MNSGLTTISVDPSLNYFSSLPFVAGKDKSEDSDDNEEADENSEDDAAAELDELADMSDIDVDDGEDDDEVLDFDEDEAGGGFDGDIDFSAAFDEEMTGRSKKRKVQKFLRYKNLKIYIL